jgi:hypothetical protein
VYAHAISQPLNLPLQLLRLAWPGRLQLTYIVGPCGQGLVSGAVLSKMDNLLLDLPVLAVGTHRLVVGAALPTVPLYVNGSYVDADLRL